MTIQFVSQVGPDTRSRPCCPACGSKAMARTVVYANSGRQNKWVCGDCRKVTAAQPHKAGVQGAVSLQLIAPHTPDILEKTSKEDLAHICRNWDSVDGYEQLGVLDRSVYDPNVFTDVGRNYLAALISYNTFTQAPGANEPAASKRRYDGVRYMVVGTGSQLETNAVDRMVTPVPFNAAGDYLAQVVAPNQLPGSGISAVFQRVYGLNEISMPTTVNVSEVGLYVSGPESSPLDPAISTHPPIAYNTFEPIPVTTSFLFSVRWEIKF